MRTRIVTVHRNPAGLRTVRVRIVAQRRDPSAARSAAELARYGRQHRAARERASDRARRRSRSLARVAVETKAIAQAGNRCMLARIDVAVRRRDEAREREEVLGLRDAIAGSLALDDMSDSASSGAT
jgi:hypothetical protein